jgi:hypothetical protein
MVIINMTSMVVVVEAEVEVGVVDMVEVAAMEVVAVWAVMVVWVVMVVWAVWVVMVWVVWAVWAAMVWEVWAVVVATGVVVVVVAGVVEAGVEVGMVLAGGAARVGDRVGVAGGHTMAQATGGGHSAPITVLTMLLNNVLELVTSLAATIMPITHVPKGCLRCHI